MQQTDSPAPGIGDRSQEQPSVARIPELDGLRGVAILLVLLLHYFYYPDPRLPKALLAFQSLFALGWSGVDLFFVLSGFLIGGILMDHRESPTYFKTFYVRRFFRIIPIYYLWITLFLLFLILFGRLLQSRMDSGTLPPINLQTFLHYFFLQNLWNVNYVTLAYWWFAPAWSLAVEEQFYLVAPWLVRYLSPRRLPAVLTAILFLAPLLRELMRLTIGGVAWPAYRLMPCRADSLALGMLAAWAWRLPRFREALVSRARLSHGVVAVLLLVVGAIAWRIPSPDDAVTQTIGYSVIAFFFCGLLLLSVAIPSGPLARIMRLGFLRALGRVSYCVYLIHLAVGYFVSGLLRRQVLHFTDWKSGLIGLLSISVTYLLGILSWRFLEHPLIRRGHRFQY